ncbi:MAG: 16S rRNA (guanine(527)-N(7))-methyltransferase RsmG [Nitrospirota bacterium]|nr:MAG: 16S rRNA (guanine(527)-N(7))-methyltransferase RsmG [Nitrospirota bacterium]
MTEDYFQPIRDISEKLGLDVHEEAIGRFGKYLAFLKKWSKAYNLTSITDDEEIIKKHFVDSLIYLCAFPDDVSTVLDAGSGAGFPGVPLKIARSGIDVYLVEPSRKKAVFRRTLIKELALSDISVVECRVEDLPCGYKGLPVYYDVVTTRALFTASELVEKVSGLSGESGIILLSKGPSYRDELEDISHLNVEVITPDLREFGMERNLIVIRK